VRCHEVTAGAARGLLFQERGSDLFLLLHGFTGAPSSWPRVLEGLPGVAMALVPWLPGHGPAGWPAALETFDAAVDALATLAREQCASPWRVVGYSLGGRLALRLALRHPALVARLTLVGCRPGLRTPDERATRRREDAALAALLREQGIAAFVAAWEKLPLFATQRALPETVRTAQGLMRLSHTAEGLARALEVLGVAAMPDCSSELGRLAMPVEIVVGELDPVYRELAVEMAAAIPHARVRVVPASGHNVVLEQPAALAELLRSAGALREET
jgi:2-succinyl-6-hydroxy-2,4-cyclohexadiene-1-carboxylate synthase